MAGAAQGENDFYTMTGRRVAKMSPAVQQQVAAAMAAPMVAAMGGAASVEHAYTRHKEDPMFLHAIFIKY